MKNYLVIPAFYEGTSFEDLVLELVHMLETLKINVEIIGQKTPLSNNLPCDDLDDNSFFNIQTDIVNELINKISSPAKILFLDFFFPSIDLIKYFLSRNKINCKLGALLHGGLFLENDLFQSERWLKYFEYGYFEAFDMMYAPSSYLKKKVPDRFKDKIKVFSWGLDYFYKSLDSEKISHEFDVIFPHRITDDKGVTGLIYIAKQLPSIQFCTTLPQIPSEKNANKYIQRLRAFENITIVAGKNRSDHTDTLKSAKIVLSCAKQENFGYAVHKAVLCGCIPVLPNRLCYPEFFDKRYLYEDLDEAIEMIKKYLGKNNKNNIMTLKSREKIPSFANLVNNFFYE